MPSYSYLWYEMYYLKFSNSCRLNLTLCFVLFSLFLYDDLNFIQEGYYLLTSILGVEIEFSYYWLR